jgi:hypothetical protein
LIRAIAVDIDGTLTDTKRVLDPLALSAISKIKVPVILVSGNTHCFTRSTAILLGTSFSFIAENGGVISYDDDTIECLSDKSICDEAYQHLGRVFQAELLDSRYRMTDVVLKRSFSVEEGNRYLDGLGLPVDLVDTDFAIHIKDRRVNKGAALLRIMEFLGICGEEVASVGDSINDIPMFEAAGFRAAVGNASPELKAISDYVARELYGRGFAEIVDYMIEKGMFEAEDAKTGLDMIF